MESFTTAIEFVSKGVPSGGSMSGSVATGDLSMWIVATFGIVLAITGSLVLLSVRKRALVCGQSSSIANPVNSKLVIAAIAILIALSTVGIIFLSGYQKAFAEGQAKASDKIRAIVDYDTSSVVVENGTIADISSDDGQLALQAVNVAAAEGVGECNWTLTIEDQQIYNDKANRKNPLQNVTIPKQEQLVSVATDMPFETAAALVGKMPVTIEYYMEKVYAISGKISLNGEYIKNGTATFVKSEDGSSLEPVIINPDGTYKMNVPANLSGYIRFRADNFVPIDTQDAKVNANMTIDENAELSCNLFGRLADSDGKAVSAAIVEMSLGEPGPEMRQFWADAESDGAFFLQVPRDSTESGEFGVYDTLQEYVFPYVEISKEDMANPQKEVLVTALKVVTPPIVEPELEYTGSDCVGVEYDAGMFEQSGDPGHATDVDDYATQLKPKAGFGWPSVQYDDLATLTEQRTFIWSIVAPTAKVEKAPFPIRDLKGDLTPQTIALEGSAINGTMQYAVTDSEAEPAEDAWQDAIEKPSDFKTYYVHYYAKGNAGYADSEHGCIRVTIYEKLLNEYTWAELKEIANRISEGEDHPEIEAMALDGMTKNTKLANGDELEFRIIAIKQDTKKDGKMAGLTFMSANCINQGYYAGDKASEDSTLASWWGESPLRASMQDGGDIFKLMPEDLSAQVAEVRKESREGWISETEFSSAVKTSIDKYFLPSGWELGTDLFGEDEGVRYEYALNDPWQLYWDSYGTGPSDNTLNHIGFNYLKQHQSEIDNPMDAHTEAYNNGGVVRVPDNPDQDIEFEYFSWLRSPFSDNPHDQGCLYYSGTVHNVGWVNFQATVAPCFCL